MTSRSSSYPISGRVLPRIDPLPSERGEEALSDRPSVCLSPCRLSAGLGCRARGRPCRLFPCSCPSPGLPTPSAHCRPHSGDPLEGLLDRSLDRVAPHSACRRAPLGWGSETGPLDCRRCRWPCSKSSGDFPVSPDAGTSSPRHGLEAPLELARSGTPLNGCGSFDLGGVAQCDSRARGLKLPARHRSRPRRPLSQGGEVRAAEEGRP